MKPKPTNTYITSVSNDLVVSNKEYAFLSFSTASSVSVRRSFLQLNRQGKTKFLIKFCR